MTATLFTPAADLPPHQPPDGAPPFEEPLEEVEPRRSLGARLSSLAGDLTEVTLLTLAVAVAGVPWRFFYTGDVLGPVTTSAIAAAVVVLLLRRAPWWAEVFFGLLASLVVAAVVIGVRGGGDGRPGVSDLRDVFRGVVHGWADLLTVTVPADFVGEVAVPPLLVAGIAATGACVLALRTRVVLLPLAFPVAGFVTVLVFTSWTAQAKVNGPQYRLSGVLVALLITELFLRTNRIALRVKAATVVAPEGAVVAEAIDPQADGGETVSAVDSTTGRTRAGVSRLLFGAPAVAAIIAGGIALAGLLPVTGDRKPYDPAAAHHEEIKIDLEVSPLAQVKPQLTLRPPVTLFTVNVQQPADEKLAVDRIRTAALTDFDGAVWSVSGTYRRAGSVLPSPVIDQAGKAVARVRVAELAPPFLPSLASPDTVVGAGDVGYDQASGVLVSERRSLRGLRYTENASVVASGDKIAELHPAVGPADALELPQRPEWLQEALLATGATGQPTTLDQLRAIERFLRQGPYMSTATSGHSYFRIKQLLLGKKPADAAAYAEQRASAFAVLARALGVPARVSVGYLLRNPTPDGTYRVTTSDVTAWPEVHDSTLGWVAFNPTDRQVENAPVKPDDKGSPTGGENSGNQAPQNDLPPVLFHRDDEPQPQDTGWRDVLIEVLIVLGIVLLCAFLLLLAGALLKPARRSWRRRRGSPSARVMAAWREMGDRLAERGHRPDPTLTPQETVLATRELVPAGAVPPLAAAAPLVSEALYAPYEPVEAHARAAWDLEAATRGEIRRGTPITERVRHWFSPRPLLPGRLSGRRGRELPAGGSRRRAFRRRPKGDEG